MTNQPEPLALLRDTEHYLSALHGSVARHDNLAANLACAGCELRDRIAAALPELAAAASAVVAPPTDQTAPLSETERRLRTENERLLHELEVMYGGAFDSLDTPPADRAALAPLKAKARELEARRLAEHRATVLREAYEIAYAEGMRLNALEAEIGVGPYRGALAVAHLLRKAISDAQQARRMADEQEAADAYDRRLNAPPSPEACEALRERLESGTAPRRRVRRTAPAGDCPHCPDGHTPADSGSQTWVVHVADDRDGDGQPTHLIVARSGGAHVAESDAQWIRARINPAEEPPPAPQPHPYTGRTGRGA